MRALGLRLLLALAILAVPAAAHAQDIEPRAYSNAPVGVNFLVGGYAFTRGGLSFDPSVPVRNAKLQTSNAVLGYARVLDLWGMSGKFDVVVPYSWLSGTAEFAGQPIEREVNGFSDARFRLSVNFYGAPALTLKEFAEYRQDLIIGASFAVTAPIGQYDSSRVVNLGTNRWSFRPELGVSKALGPVTLEYTAGSTFFTENTDFLGGRTRSQEPIVSMQGHAIYSFRPGTLGVGHGELPDRRTHRDRWRHRRRPAAELARGRDPVHSAEPQLLRPALRQPRRVRADREQLRPDRRRPAVPLGRWILRCDSVRAIANGGKRDTEIGMVPRWGRHQAPKAGEIERGTVLARPRRRRCQGAIFGLREMIEKLGVAQRAAETVSGSAG